MKHIGIIGGGGISETHARAANEIPGVEITAFFGDNYEKTSQLSQRFGGTAYPEFETFLDHQPLDFVIIGSNGGGEYIAFDTRKGVPWAIVAIDMVAGGGSAEVIAPDFDTFTDCIGVEYETA